MSTIQEQLVQAEDAFGDYSTSPRLDAEVLLAHVLNCTRSELVTRWEKEMSEPDVQKFHQLIEQRKQQTPIAYLTGVQEFMGQMFTITQNVLVPRPATELIVEKVLEYLSSDTTLVIADIGTGSGVIAVTLASHLPHVRIIASDISAEALSVANDNAQKLGVPSRITFVQTNLLDQYPVPPDIIVANLPYLNPSQMKEKSISKEPKLALAGGRDGIELIDTLIHQAVNTPNLQGLFLEFDPSQTDIILQKVHKTWPHWSTKVITDGNSVRGLQSTK